jgi:BirA family biotin operon repressor/biotin-[acetyl-CoA-carboxylase] ligase
LNKLDWNIILIQECDSTNNYTKQLKANGGIDDRTALMTFFQLHGKGQAKNRWYSSAGKNILLSLYRKLDLNVSQNFMLTIITSLAIHKLLLKYEIVSKIKWPNDIYVGNHKITGVLIENSLMRDKITDTIIGIGLNVNEEVFPEWISNGCSMYTLHGVRYTIEAIRDELINYIDEFFLAFEHKGGRDLFHQYNALLYRLNDWFLFKCNGEVFNGRIHGVEPDGRLLLETNEGNMLQLMFGEVEYVI